MKTFRKTKWLFSLLLFFIGITILHSCCLFDNDCGSKPYVLEVFKFKNGKDYSKQAIVYLSENKEKIIGYPDPVPEKFPIKLDSNYYLDVYGRGLRTGYLLSVTREEINSHSKKFHLDSIIKKQLVVKDPYIECYQAKGRKKYKRIFLSEGKIDTVFINSLIKKGKLKTFFKRLK